MADPLHKDSTTETPLEIELILCSSRTRVGAEMAERIRHLAAGRLDWQRLLELAAANGVVPLVYKNLKEVCPEILPQKFAYAIENHFYTNTVRNQMLTEELCRLLKIFESNGIEPVIYKGPALALEIYGDLSLRQFNDLDVMIRERDLPAVSQLLLAEGYSQQWVLTPAQEAAYVKHDCERLYALAGKQIFMDVHWDFVRRYFPIKLYQERLRERTVEANLGCATARTFAPEDLLIILCVHACKDLWTKLIWIADVAELIAAHPWLDWQRIVREAKSARTLRMLLLGLFLARSLLGADVPEELFQRAVYDESVTVLAARVRSRLFSGAESPSSSEEFLFYLRLNERLSEKACYSLRYLLTSNPADWSMLRLPDSLFFLYSLVRTARLLFKHR